MHTFFGELGESNKIPDHIPTQGENPKGLHQRYHIQKIVPADGTFDDGDSNYKTVPVDDNAEYFVMRLDEGGKDPEHIKACRIGVNAYADAIAHHIPELAKDLKERYPVSSVPIDQEGRIAELEKENGRLRGELLYIKLRDETPSQPSWISVVKELVELKDMKDGWDILEWDDPAKYHSEREDYLKREPLAWQSARELLKSVNI